MALDSSLSVLQKIEHHSLAARNIELYVKRDDLIHPEVSGNKWRKLKYNIEQFYASKKKQILTFGGAYSNHLLATASACHLLNIKAIGVVRGEELNSASNKVLNRCQELGMQLHFVTREEYGVRSDKEYLEELSIEFPNSYIIPEGGANYFGIIGSQEILKEINLKFDQVFIAQGTTTTSCGVLLSSGYDTLNVVPVLKGYDAIAEMKNLLSRAGFESDLIETLLEKVNIHDQYHFGGYGKTTPALLNFVEEIGGEMTLPLDEVYTAKAFFALMEALHSGNLDNQRVLFIHTGGLYLVH